MLRFLADESCDSAVVHALTGLGHEVLSVAELSPDGYLDNMGMTLAFNTQARPGPTKRIFGSGCSLTGLNVGEALCRIRSEAKTRKIVSWEP